MSPAVSTAPRRGLLTWTLRGTWLASRAPDVVRPAELVLTASLPPRGTAGPRHLALHGQLHLDGWLNAAPVTGQLSLVPGLRLGVRYDLDVLSTPPMRLAFSLSPRLDQPIDSVTRLCTTLTSDDGAVGVLHLRFDVRRDLAPHLLTALRGRKAPSSPGTIPSSRRTNP